MLNVGIGEYRVSNNQSEIMITHALGSCVALIIHCNHTNHTAMAHIVLPENSSIRNRALYKMKPGYFASDIVPVMVNYFLNELGCKKSQLEVHLIGGAVSGLPTDQFLVGQKNKAMVRHLVSTYGLKIDDSETGKRYSRTVTVKVSNGHIHVKRQNMIL
ncbi:Protein-glutamine glutaminase [Petrocella atlantisensis]|uniref:Protein-glutamine glutaminase n=1 Tax=Petrocella atlantisensis TaxID=2173034 RepID=A0A3P7S302_9FIRM|nr:chemotaxis protein CheD [Petrocella atlantisensis]MCF8018897.1 chemotaxis protein CheD [Vallitaleaceae bacterium]VDN49002.1 Protein-glutamine glutaminase [Petrocella atlantisensis]